MRRTFAAAAGHALAVALIALLFVACGDKKDDTSGSAAPPAPTAVAGGVAMPYTDGDGIPELTATPSYAPTSLAAHETVTVTVSADADTKGVTVWVPFDQGSIATYSKLTPVTPGTTNDYTVDLIPFVAAGVYSAHVNLCSLEDCGSSADGGTGGKLMEFAPNPTNDGYLRTDTRTGEQTNIAVKPSSFAVTASTKGTQADPLELTLATSMHGWVKGGERSYYRLATTAGTLYSLTMSQGGQTVLAPADFSAGCGPVTTLQKWVCVLPAAGTQLDYATTNPLVAGGQYDLLAREHTALGTATAPGTISLGTAYPGAVPAGGTAHYKVGGATATKTYVLAMWESVGQNLDLTNYNGDSTFLTATCQPPGSQASEICSFIAAADTIYFKVADVAGVGGTFTVFAQESYESEGTSIAPMGVTPGTPLNGTVGPAQGSYYTATVAAGAHTVTVTGLSAPGSLSVQSVDFNSHPQGDFCTQNSSTFRATLTCTYTPTGTTLHIRVAAGVLGASYILLVQ